MSVMSVLAVLAVDTVLTVLTVTTVDTVTTVVTVTMAVTVFSFAVRRREGIAVFVLRWLRRILFIFRGGFLFVVYVYHRFPLHSRCIRSVFFIVS